MHDMELRHWERGSYRAFGAEVRMEGGGMTQEKLGACLTEQVEGRDTRHQTRRVLSPSLTCG